MEKFTKSTKKFEIVQKESIEKIEKYNLSIKKIYLTFEKKLEKNKEKIEKLQEQVVQAETKLWETERERDEIFKRKYPIQIKANRPIEEEFFSNVTASAIAINRDDGYQSERVYLKNGKWFTIGVYYPTKPDGGIDDEHPYIKTEEIEVKK